MRHCVFLGWELAGLIECLIKLSLSNYSLSAYYVLNCMLGWDSGCGHTDSLADNYDAMWAWRGGTRSHRCIERMDLVQAGALGMGPRGREPWVEVGQAVWFHTQQTTDIWQSQVLTRMWRRENAETLLVECKLEQNFGKQISPKKLRMHLGTGWHIQTCFQFFAVATTYNFNVCLY
jgi:hypothetical protein